MTQSGNAVVVFPKYEVSEMKLIFSGFSAGVLSLALAVPASAQLTAEQARDEMFSLYETGGYVIEIGAQSKADGTLRLEDIAMSFDLPNGEGEIVMGMDWLELTEISGTVEVTYPDAMFINARISQEFGDDVVFDAVTNFVGVNTLMSGSPEVLRVETSADNMDFRVEKINVNGQDIPLNVLLDMAGAVSDYTLERGADERLKMTGVASLMSMALKANAAEPGGSGLFVADVQTNNMAMEFAMDIGDFLDPEQFLKDGFDMAGTMTTGGTSIDVNFVDGDNRFAMTSTSTGGLLGFSLSNDGISYDIAQSGVQLNVSSSELPIPAVSLAYDEVAFALDVPLSAASEPRDFAMSAALRNLTVSEAIWSMVDPGQQVPRDPATIAVAITGKVMVLVDLMDPETIASIDNMESPPMLPVSASLDELLVSFGGAMLTGDGSATLDLANATMVGGIPLPVGEVNLKLTGAFGLLDKLVAMGLVPSEPSMMARGVIGAFAKPVGEDDFETKLEVTEEGAILANGQRIQ
jgi:uncharacterized protein DUF2125